MDYYVEDDVYEDENNVSEMLMTAVVMTKNRTGKGNYKLHPQPRNAIKCKYISCDQMFFYVH